MSFTAFPVLADILKSTNRLLTPIGTLTISCAAMNDIMGWCSLAWGESSYHYRDFISAKRIIRWF
jgi:Kef-type K+ transport system membrane component KefB